MSLKLATVHAYGDVLVVYDGEIRRPHTLGVLRGFSGDKNQGFRLAWEILGKPTIFEVRLLGAKTNQTSCIRVNGGLVSTYRGSKWVPMGNTTYLTTTLAVDALFGGVG